MPHNSNFKLCTFNLQNLFLVPTDQVPNPLVYKSIDKREWLARTIQEIDADIYMLTEIGGVASLDYFNDKYLDSKYIPSCIKGNSDREIEVGFLIKKTLPFKYKHYTYKNKEIDFLYPFEIEKNKRKEENLIPSHKMSRDIAELEIKDRDTDEHIFTLLLVHLKSQLDKDNIDPSGNLRREAEAKFLKKVTNALTKQSPEVPIIIAGDFNNELFKEENWDLQPLRDLPHRDILEVLDLPPDQRTTHVHFSREKGALNQQLDYILIPKSVEQYVCPNESGIVLFKDVHGNRLGYPQEHYHRYSYPSDHYPLVCTLNKKIFENSEP